MTTHNLAKSDAQNHDGCLSGSAIQGQEVIHIAGHIPIMLSDYRLAGLLKVARLLPVEACRTN